MELKKNPKRGRIIGENQKDKNKTGRRGQKSEEGFGNSFIEAIRKFLRVLLKDRRVEPSLADGRTGALTYSSWY